MSTRSARLLGIVPPPFGEERYPQTHRAPWQPIKRSKYACQTSSLPIRDQALFVALIPGPFPAFPPLDSAS